MDRRGDRRMAHVVVLFNLKDGVSDDEYRQWARQRDIPTVNGLASVNSFRVFEANGLLGGGESPFSYIEVIDVADMDGLMIDISSEAMQAIAAEFAELADSPTFILTEELGS
jgi:hypothetical protein